MSQPYIGEIRLLGFNFPPLGWELCAGQLVPISQNEALFQLIGTTYGGDGQSTFGLPDLRGRAPIHWGTGPGLSTYVVGELLGTETVTLTPGQLPMHGHPFFATTNQATLPAAQNNLAADTNRNAYSTTGVVTTQLNAQSVGPVGGSQPHENMQPFLVGNYCISMYGIFPSPS